MDEPIPDNKKRSWRRKHTVGVVLLAGAVLTLWQPSKYVLLSDGPSKPVTGRIEKSNNTVRTYESEGRFNLVTVFVSRATWWEYILAQTPWSDAKAVELPVSRQDKSVSKADMISSEQTASLVAEEYVFGEVSSVQQAGALVVEVVEGMPAERAGVQEGDIVKQINGAVVKNANEAAKAVAKGNNRVKLTIQRGEETISLTSMVEDGKIGVRISDHYNGEPLLRIDNGEVGGASAGLAMTLAFIDYLTPGDLTSGNLYAATGVINADGSVDQVDGVNFKATGAIKEGIATMFVPHGQASEVTVEGIKVIEVKTVQDAIDYLCSYGADDDVCRKTA